MRTLILTAAIVLGFALRGEAADPFPGQIGGSFELVDQTGAVRTHVDPDGHGQLLFFGYANCPDICTAALPLMAEVTDRLARRGLPVRPVMITVDPRVDTVETLAAPMARIHPRFLGLTGPDAALQASYDAFGIEITPLFTAPDGQTIYAHGSFIYLLDHQGALLTLIPPILGPEEAARIAARYLMEG